MTEEEKDRLRQAKEDVTGLLAGTDIDRYRLTEVDSRLDDYVREVAGDPEAHNLYEQLAVARFSTYAISTVSMLRRCGSFATSTKVCIFPARPGSNGTG